VEPSLPPSRGAGPRTPRAYVEELADRLGTSVVSIVAGGVAVAVALVLVVAVLASRSPSSLPELTIPYAEGAGDPSGTSPAPTAASPSATSVPAEVLVHAAGAVAHPGVYSLPVDARVGDLLAAAGGPVGGADVNRLNLAAPLTDGTRVYVPIVGEDAPPAVLGPDVGGSAGASGGPIDLNRADASALEALPGVGPATAAAIVAHREQHGPFRSVDDLLDVRGIGDSKLAAMRDLVTV